MFFDSKPKGWSVSPEFNELSGQYRRNIQFRDGSGYIDKEGYVYGDWKYTDNYSDNYSSRELDDLRYDAFEGEQDAYDEWSQR